MLKIPLLSAVLMTVVSLLPAAEPPSSTQPAGTAWWHRSDIVKALNITPELQERMDRVLQVNIGKRVELRTDFRKASRAFREALGVGDWKKAQRAAGSLAGIAATRDRLGSSLKIDILSLLSKEQLARLTVDFPKVVRGPWIRRTEKRNGKKEGRKHSRKQQH